MKAKLVVVAGRASEKEVSIELPFAIGRSRDAGLTVLHPTVSRLHCEIFDRDGKLVIRDLNSTNGTFIGKKRIAEAVLESGDQITVGPLTFAAHYEAVNGTAKAPATSNGAATIEPDKIQPDDDEFSLLADEPILVDEAESPQEASAAVEVDSLDDVELLEVDASDASLEADELSLLAMPSEQDELSLIDPALDEPLDEKVDEAAGPAASEDAALGAAAGDEISLLDLGTDDEELVADAPADSNASLGLSDDEFSLVDDLADAEFSLDDAPEAEFSLKDDVEFSLEGAESNRAKDVEVTAESASIDDLALGDDLALSDEIALGDSADVSLAELPTGDESDDESIDESAELLTSEGITPDEKSSEMYDSIALDDVIDDGALNEGAADDDELSLSDEDDFSLTLDDDDSLPALDKISDTDRVVVAAPLEDSAVVELQDLVEPAGLAEPLNLDEPLGLSVAGTEELETAAELPEINALELADEPPAPPVRRPFSAEDGTFSLVIDESMPGTAELISRLSGEEFQPPLDLELANSAAEPVELESADDFDLPLDEPIGETDAAPAAVTDSAAGDDALTGWELTPSGEIDLPLLADADSVIDSLPLTEESSSIAESLSLDEPLELESLSDADDGELDLPWEETPSAELIDALDEPEALELADLDPRLAGQADGNSPQPFVEDEDLLPLAEIRGMEEVADPLADMSGQIPVDELADEPVITAAAADDDELSASDELELDDAPFDMDLEFGDEFKQENNAPLSGLASLDEDEADLAEMSSAAADEPLEFEESLDADLGLNGAELRGAGSSDAETEVTPASASADKSSKRGWWPFQKGKPKSKPAAGVEQGAGTTGAVAGKPVVDPFSEAALEFSGFDAPLMASGNAEPELATDLEELSTQVSADDLACLEGVTQPFIDNFELADADLELGNDPPMAAVDDQELMGLDADESELAFDAISDDAPGLDDLNMTIAETDLDATVEFVPEKLSSELANQANVADESPGNGSAEKKRRKLWPFGGKKAAAADGGESAAAPKVAKAPKPAKPAKAPKGEKPAGKVFGFSFGRKKGIKQEGPTEVPVAGSSPELDPFSSPAADDEIDFLGDDAGGSLTDDAAIEFLDVETPAVPAKASKASNGPTKKPAAKVKPPEPKKESSAAPEFDDAMLDDFLKDL